MKDISDEARRLFAEVVEKCWDKYPELVVPGWEGELVDWQSDLGNYEDNDILAAAALCAEWNPQGRGHWVCWVANRWVMYDQDDPSNTIIPLHVSKSSKIECEFAAVLAEATP